MHAGSAVKLTKRPKGARLASLSRHRHGVQPGQVAGFSF